MTIQLDILAALKAMAIAALPAADLTVIEPGDDMPAADRISPGGRIIIEYGEPGDAEIDLCPPTYNYDHQIPVTFAASKALDGESAVAAVAAMLTAFGIAIVADRTLGGLVQYLDATAPSIESLFSPGSTPAREAQAILTATYSTTSPL